MKKAIFVVIFLLLVVLFPLDANAVGDVWGKITYEEIKGLGVETHSVVLMEVNLDLCYYPKGDFNVDGKVNITDIIDMIGYIFRGGDAPVSEWLADCDGDNVVTVSDVLYLYNYVFKGGLAPIC